MITNLYGKAEIQILIETTKRTQSFNFKEGKMKQLRLSLFLILILLLTFLTGCNQPVYQYPKTKEEITSLFQEHKDEFELFAANCLKNLTTGGDLQIHLISQTKEYQYWRTTPGNSPVLEQKQPVYKLMKGDELLGFFSSFPVKVVQAEDSYVAISLYDAKKYDGNLAMQQSPDYITYQYVAAGGLLLEKEIMEKSGGTIILNDYWFADDPSLAVSNPDSEEDTYGYLTHSLELLKEDGFEVKEAVITAFELPQLGLTDDHKAITGEENRKADYLFEITENCLLLSYERNTKVTALLVNPIDGTVLSEQQFSIPTNAAGTYRILQLSDQLWLYAPRSARGEEQLFIPFLCTETGMIAQPTIRLPEEAASWIDGKASFLTNESGIYRIAYLTGETESLVVQEFADGQVQGEPTRYDLQALGLQESTQLKDIAFLSEHRLVFSWTGNTDGKNAFTEYCGYGFLDPMNAQVQRIPFGGTNLMISGKRVLVGNTLDFIRLSGGDSADTTQPEVVNELHQIHIINETGDPIVMAQPALNHMLYLDEGFQTQQVAISVFGGYSRKMGYAFAFFDTNTKEWQQDILKLPEIYPVTRNFSEDSDRGIYVGTISAAGKKIYLLGYHYDETLKKYTGYPLLITAQLP